MIDGSGARRYWLLLVRTELTDEALRLSNIQKVRFTYGPMIILLQTFLKLSKKFLAGKLFV